MARNIDWEAIEQEYRAGALSLRQIAENHHVSHTAIEKHAKKEGWARDLSERIRLLAEKKVASAEVSAAVAKRKQASERELVEAKAAQAAEIKISHTALLSEARDVAFTLLSALKATSVDPETIRRAAVAIEQGDAEALERAVGQVVALPALIEQFRKLMDAVQKLVTVERLNHGLDARSGEIGGGGSITFQLNTQ